MQTKDTFKRENQQFSILDLQITTQLLS